MKKSDVLVILANFVGQLPPDKVLTVGDLHRLLMEAAKSADTTEYEYWHDSDG